MSSGFVTEAELADARRKRQEEWEKVRTEDQPEEAPEEEYDSRSLYDRLQEQKNKKDMEYEEAHKLKNMIKTLDDDEVEFLDLVDKNKINAERQAHIEEQKEMNEFRQKVATLQEKRLEEQIQQQISKPKPTKTPIASSRMSQKKILAGVVVKKRKHEEEPSSTLTEEKKPENVTEPAKPEASKATQSGPPKPDQPNKKLKSGALQVIGILPGLGSYRESTDSEASSDSEVDCDGHFDWIGRKIVKANAEGK
ncbi:PSME3-interacting protein isoform X2 [Culex pipiens pallens]|uniref:PSME3-interacting protein isoform X2 n=1 Tax=Culex pipiens pallens TaxID=42434 RepID=UPI0019544423|nr:PSME3-interacting protein isoform X2 [Culex pipiens pallens]